MKKIIDPSKELVRAMKESSPKWDAIVRIIEDEKKDIEHRIFNRESLTDKQVSDLIVWRNFLAYVINLPEEIVSSFENRPKQEEADFETYDSPKPLKLVRDAIINGT